MLLGQNFRPWRVRGGVILVVVRASVVVRGKKPRPIERRRVTGAGR